MLNDAGSSISCDRQFDTVQYLWLKQLAYQSRSLLLDSCIFFLSVYMHAGSAEPSF